MLLSPHAVRVFSLWILLYWKHQETTRDNRKDCGKETSHEIDVVVDVYKRQILMRLMEPRGVFFMCCAIRMVFQSGDSRLNADQR